MPRQSVQSLERREEAMTGEGDRSEGAPVLSSALRTAVSFQSYDPQDEIEGVFLLPLRKHRSENGALAELMRIDSRGRIQLPQGDFSVRQISVSTATPDRLNAFHIHPRIPQNELWTVLSGQLLVWLVDCREGSVTEGLRQKVILSAEEPAFLHIPAGIAHGYRAGPSGALLVYAMDQQFQPERPNEGRLPWDYFGQQLWEEDRG